MLRNLTVFMLGVVLLVGGCSPELTDKPADSTNEPTNKETEVETPETQVAAVYELKIEGMT